MPFNSRKFRGFARDLGIKVTTSSPVYPQSNGQAEWFVQTLKNLFKKADEDSRDPYLALMEYHNTPITSLKYSPAQLLMSRTQHSKLPTAEKLLRPKVDYTHDALKRRQVRRKTYCGWLLQPTQVVHHPNWTGAAPLKRQAFKEVRWAPTSVHSPDWWQCRGAYEATIMPRCEASRASSRWHWATRAGGSPWASSNRLWLKTRGARAVKPPSYLNDFV